MTSPLRPNQVDLQPDMIDLGIGQPGFSLLPLDAMRKAAAHRLGLDDTTLLNYGAEQGDGAFLRALASFLSEGYGVSVQPEHLFVTAGASQALDLLCTLLTQPGDVVFVEEPSYFIGLRILSDRGLKMVGIPTDAHGMDMDALESQLADTSPRFVYTIPTFQNPTGATLSARRRERLVALSQEYDFLIVADEVYHLLGYTETPPPPLAGYCDAERVISLSSFSKILAPGLRLGWIQAAPIWIERLVNMGLVFSGGSLNHFTSNLVRSALELGLQQAYLAQLKQTYQRRAAVLSNALHDELGDAVRFAEPHGGFFIWGQLPEGVDTKETLARAKAQKVGFQPGVHFSSHGRLQNFLRLSFAFYEEDELIEGVMRLARVLQ